MDSVSSSSTPEQSQLPPQDSGEDEKERSAGDQEGEDIVTFEEFKAKMSEAVPTNQPQQGERERERERERELPSHSSTMPIFACSNMVCLTFVTRTNAYILVLVIIHFLELVC